MNTFFIRAEDMANGHRTKLTHPYNYDPITTYRIDIEPNGSVYSDRLFQWDSKKHDDLCMKYFDNRGQYWSERDPIKIQNFLREYLMEPDLVLCEIQEQCNQSNGYPVWFFTYRAQGDKS